MTKLLSFASDWKNVHCKGRNADVESPSKSNLIGQFPKKKKKGWEMHSIKSASKLKLLKNPKSVGFGI